MNTLTTTTRNDTTIEVKQNFEYFIELQNNDTGISLDGIGDIANILFNLKDDSISMQLRLALHSRGLRTTSDDDSTEDDITRDTRFTLQRCEIIDKDHIEVKLIRDMNSKCSHTRDEYHDIMAVEDGKIVMIEPYFQYNDITDETRSDSTDSSNLSSSLLSHWSDRRSRLDTTTFV